MKTKLTQNRLKELLKYNYNTGLFTWRIRPSTFIKSGSTAGCIENGYRRIKIDNNKYQAHRLIYLYVYGRFPYYQIDHINKDKLDNRISNLRDVQQSINMWNRDIRSTNKSGVTGVHYDKESSKWRVGITKNNKKNDLGRFKKLIDAVCARYNAEINCNYNKYNTESSAYLYLKERGLL